MFPMPTYAEDIIVGVVIHKIFAWYVTDKEYWYLDYTKYDDALLASGFTDSTLGDYSNRFGIPILDTDTADSFLSHIADRRVPASVLSHMMVARKDSPEEEDLLDFSPCLLVNFDQKKLLSQYPEMIRFEIYVPDGWLGVYQDFLSEVPEEARYWIVDGYDLFKSN